MKRVSIITVNFNHSYVTDELLNSIRDKNSYTNIEIIVVDNGSKEDPVPQWKIKYPEAIFIRSATNLGFAGGNNLGLSVATGDYLFFVNNDTEFTEGLVDILVNTLDSHPSIGVISPKLLYYDQPTMLQYAGYTPMNYLTARNSCIGQFETDQGQYDQLVGPTGFAHGAAMMVTKTAIEKAGPMAENFFLYYEELDWADRIRHNGFEVWVNMKATIFHKESVSVGKKSALKEYYMNRNRILFIRRNAPLVKAIFFYIYFLLVVTPRNIISYIKEKNYPFIKQLFRAIWWNLSNGINSSHLGYKP
ncbi:MAG TPA: glycosyltransferase family 2 protein [Sediminibacterium sp.]|uniref:glycosyltransferase family 2 protein n=1 Tax=Sediminibacterium sp. TaxID=1917865 RepID=UPI0008B913D8|nr:glycosyltransferase family 2 protein [Sediminibacterium sp.]OHC85637.1 MAG: glycosyl transferase [Sphingobacteriia bacterium RIFOXYC2_FULL_35_18]OHC89300.1 MAG: glycosyl transferase [Sphingobacteriia bacterium RIFOXYD2_FULL_35_12]HLD52722.1 glycosyltransferase family 2 protein [Sediminibacterium sp.]